MISQEFTEHITSLLDSLPSLQENQATVQVHEYSDLLHEVIALALNTELQLFSSHYAEWVFLAQKYPHCTSATNAYKHFISLMNSPSAQEHSTTIQFLCRTILSILAGLQQEEYINDTIDIEKSISQEQVFRGVITSWHVDDAYLFIECQNTNQEQVMLRISHEHSLFKTLWKGATIHLTDSIIDDHGQYTSTEKTLCVLEPDILLTATDIAECTTNGDQLSIGSMFIRKFSKKESGIPLLAGIIAGNWLDKAIAGDTISIDNVVQSTLKSMPLQALNAIKGEEDISKLMDICTTLKEALDALLDSFDAPMISTEAAFMAPMYGLLGRLDILMEYEDQLQKTVIELKSGNAPNTGLPVHFRGLTIPMGAWKNHILQVACYNLLLDAAFPGRTGDSRLLYPKDVQNPIRNVINNHLSKKEALRIRNEIISLEHDIIHRKFSSFIELFSDEALLEMTPYTRDEVMKFKTHFQQLDKTSELYVLASLSFILREQQSARLGSGNNPGLSSLWHHTIDEKQQKLQAIGYLRIDSASSDFDLFHIHVRYTDRSQRMSSLRIGDIILFMPHEALSVQGQILGHIHKATIRSISNEGIFISLRNKVAQKEQFTSSDTLWCIEADAGNESLYTSLLRSLGDIVRSDIEKRHRILGLNRPSIGNLYDGPIPVFLHSTQKDLLRQILSSKDYFLLQGPPGTGKTSAMIRSMIECLMQDENERIMLCAFTNRAVDELCAAVDSLNLPFIRLGSKHATAFPHSSLQYLSETMSLEDLRSEICSSRIIISTVSTVHTHTEIHEWFSTTTMIIDEASQLLEPQVSGILMHTKRFILIGDERQLPAVITQDIRGTKLQHPLFEDIALSDFRHSLFERLLKLCMRNGDTHAYGMLTIQARMHQDISAIVSSMHYGNRLQSMNPWQSAEDDIPLKEYPRLTWIATKPELQYKIHHAEAELAVSLASRALQKQTVQEIGIITPFRSQIALIQSLIPDEYKPQITVDTVERFQGSERELIIISLAIHNEFHAKGIESFAEIEGEMIDRKLNVALTRAKKQCIILGCPEALRKDSPYAHLYNRLSQQN